MATNDGEVKRFEFHSARHSSKNCWVDFDVIPS